MKFPWQRATADEVPDDFELDLEKLMTAVSERIGRFVLDGKLGDREMLVNEFGLELSPETWDAEIEESEERVARLNDLNALFLNYAALTVHSVTARMRDQALATEEDPDSVLAILAGLHVLMEYATFSGIRATVAQLEDMGLITYTWESQ
jgi:hypothetical protein